jgi:hypothetical protein
MRDLWKLFVVSALLLAIQAPTANADEFKLGDDQNISCTRGHRPGKLSTVVCKSYAYVFNVKTTEYFRCSVALSLTRDNKEVINLHTDGECTKKPRIFESDSNYTFVAVETEPPNTNSIFGAGGYVVWASDSAARRIRGCITISSGLGSDVSKCMDMTLQ